MIISVMILESIVIHGCRGLEYMLERMGVIIIPYRASLIKDYSD
jgi:hypothetical protein